MEYDGKPKYATPVVSLDGVVLQEGVDYKLSYSGNAKSGNVGKATVKIKGMGGLTGNLSLEYNIIAGTISASDIAPIPAANATGKQITPNPVVTVNGTTLKREVDYTVSYGANIDAGIGTVTVNGRGAYNGSATVTFKIVAPAGNDLSKAKVSAVSDQTFTGSPITPTPKVTLNGSTLLNGRDYTLSYSNNVKVGKATLVIMGRGAYSGSVLKTFTIKAAAISGVTASGMSSTMAYTGEPLTQAGMKLKFGSYVLTEGVDYRVMYSNNVKRGKATITVTGYGNFSGSKKFTFTIK